MVRVEDAILKNLEVFVAFARKRLGDHHLAEDVVQESLMKALAADPYNRLGKWSDDDAGEAAALTRRVRATHTDFGRFKVPSLREAARTAPYMHDGRYATLTEAVRHYSELDMNRLHVHGEQLLRPLRLKDGEIADLVAFLESLSAPRLTRAEATGYSACP